MKSTFCWMLSLFLAAGAFAQTPGEKKDAPKDAPKEAPKEAPKDAPKEEAKEAPKPSKDDPKHKEAVELLKKVDEATKALKSVSYKASRQGSGWLAARAGKSEGKVITSGKGDQAQFRIECKLQLADSSEPRELVVGHDAENYYLIDPNKKIVYADLDQAVLGSDGRAAGALVMLEFGHPTPFSDEIESDHAEIIGTVKIGDQECNQVHVQYRANLEAVWYFSKKDNLPRRVDRIAKSPQGEKGAAELTITDLVVDPKSTEDPFKLVVPAGYEKTDEFAPNRRPPQ